jgi:type IV secretory pathway TraG/TraD family ATPase VirD4
MQGNSSFLTIRVARSYGMWFLIGMQDLGQLWHIYGADTPLWGTCRTKIFHGPANDLTAKRLEDMLGPQTLQAISAHQGPQPSRSVYATGRPLMTAAEILGLPPDVLLIWTQGCPQPIRATKLRLYTEVSRPGSGLAHDTGAPTPAGRRKEARR